MTESSAALVKFPCSFCGSECAEGANFCSRCGKNPRTAKVVYSEFELGRIAMLHDMKKEIRVWVGGSVIFVGLLGWFGVSQIIPNTVASAVTTAVEQKMHTMQTTIDTASSQAMVSTAKAEIQLEAAQKVIDEMGARKGELSKAIAELEQSSQRLDESLRDMDARKKALEASISELQRRESDLNKIIKDENLVTIFAKLRSDLYRIHSLSARVTINITGTGGKQLPAAFLFPHMLDLRKGTGSQAQDVAEFDCDTSSPTVIVDPASDATVGGVVRCELFEPFERLLNQPLTALDSISTLHLNFQQTGATADNNLDALLPYFKSISVELDANGIPLTIQPVAVDEVRKQKGNTFLQHGASFVDVAVDVSSDYKDVNSLYDSKLAEAQ